MLRTANCCCGQATIEVKGNPKIHLVCNCNNCKERTGSAFGISAYFDNAQVKNINGNTEIYKIDTDTTQQERFFCKSCGTTLYWKISKFNAIPDIDKMTGIAGGCFTENPLPEPVLLAANDQKCSWIEMEGLKVVS